MGRRGGEMGDGGSVLYLVLRIGDCGVSGKNSVEVRSDGGGGKIELGRYVKRVVLVFCCWWRFVVEFDTGSILVWLVVVLFDRNGLGFGLRDDLLRLALNISAGGCCDRLNRGGCVMEWGSVKGVVSPCATRVASVEVGLERLTGINGEG